MIDFCRVSDNDGSKLTWQMKLECLHDVYGCDLLWIPVGESGARWASIDCGALSGHKILFGDEVCVASMEIITHAEFHRLGLCFDPFSRSCLKITVENYRTVILTLNPFGELLLTACLKIMEWGGKFK